MAWLNGVDEVLKCRSKKFKEIKEAMYGWGESKNALQKQKCVQRSLVNSIAKNTKMQILLDFFFYLPYPFLLLFLYLIAQFL